MVSIKQTRPKQQQLKNVHSSSKIVEKKNSKLPKNFVSAPRETDVVIPKPAVEKAGKEVLKKRKNRYIVPSKYIKENIAESCLSALLQLAEQYKKKNKLFEDETPIFAELRSIKIQSTKGNVKLCLAHSTVASTGEVCLITPDIKKGRRRDHEPTVERWEEILRNAGVTTVKTILPMRQLRVEFDQYELKRRLLTQHDFIMVDTRVLNHVSHELGKMFFKKHNMLVPVRLDEKEDVKKAIDTGLRTVMLRLNEGATSTVTIGHTGMSLQQLKENVLALVQQLKDKFPGGEMNIRAISLKMPLSLSLPLYITLRPANAVAAPKMKQCRPKNSSVLEGELSTFLDTSVKVAPDGTVRLVNSKSRAVQSDMDEDDEEGEEEGMEDDEEKQQV